jgi:N-acetylglucosamine malate deacetylase 2
MEIKSKKLVCIFAHPDDEAFGPGGTIAKFSSQGTKIYEICLTKGDANGDEKLGKIREQELSESAKILGVKNLTFLDFHDGDLKNNNYHEVTDKLEKLLNKIKPDTIMTFAQNGVSGHLDHIAVSMECSYLFERLKFIKNIMYFCEKKEVKKIIGKKYFVYFPNGYSEQEVDQVIDVSPFFATKLKAMKAHKSQRSDYLMIRSLFGKYLKKEYFKVSSK